MTVQVFQTVVALVSGISSIIALLVLLVKPIREKLLGTKQVREGLRCMLRSDMLRVYYKHREDDRIRQHEKEAFILEYSAYKALGGNSFIDDVCAEVRKWEVVT